MRPGTGRSTALEMPAIVGLGSSRKGPRLTKPGGCPESASLAPMAEQVKQKQWRALVSFGMRSLSKRRPFPRIQPEDSTLLKVCGVDSHFRGNDCAPNDTTTQRCGISSVSGTAPSDGGHVNEPRLPQRAEAGAADDPAHAPLGFRISGSRRLGKSPRSFLPTACRLLLATN
jgi:hypothetical protein